MSRNQVVRLMDIHRSAMGHVVGRNGMTIKRIRQEYDVSTYNTNFGDEKDGYTTFHIKGQLESVNKAVKDICNLIEISNEWCKKNNYKYC